MKSDQRSPACDVDGDDIGCDGLGLLPHPLLRRGQPERRLHLRVAWGLVSRSRGVPAGGVVDGVQDQRGQRSHEPLVLL